MIPQQYNDAVLRALKETFGAAEYDDVSALSGGQTSSLVYRLVVRKRPYLLKIIRRSDDASRHYQSMKAAAEAGIAPRVLYANVQDKISITDFVETKPLAVSEARVRLPVLLRTLHSLPSFGQSHFNTTCTFLLHKGPGLDGWLEKFRSADLLAGSDTEEFFARYRELAAIYPTDEADLVSSHNDLFKPDNILFDGSRVLLVDWEAAFSNDRYADLAVVANQIASTEQEELTFLGEYFGAAPDRFQVARLHVMQQIAHLFYTIAFLSLGSNGSRRIDWETPVPEFTELQRGIWCGDFNLADDSVKVLYGRAHWQKFLENVRNPRYCQSNKVLSENLPRAR